MANLGNIGTILPHSLPLIKYEDSGPVKLLYQKQLTYVDTRAYSVNQKDNVLRNIIHYPISLNRQYNTTYTRIFNNTYIKLKWLVFNGSNTFDISIKLNQVSDYDPKVIVSYGNSIETFTGNKASTAVQSIAINYTNLQSHMYLDIYLDVRFSNTVRKPSRFVDWYLTSDQISSGYLNPEASGSGGGGVTLCPYPIGEEKPIDYGTIELTGSSANELTFTIPASTVSSTVTDAQILLTLSPYGSNVNGTIENIFTELSGLYKKLYVKDSAVSLKIDTETWNDSDNFAKIWITIPTLTTASKDLVLEFDSGSLDNPINTMLGLIGF